MKKIIPVFIFLIFSFFSIRPLFHSGFFPMHDDTQVVRVSQMAKALSDEQFPVRWVADLGYGYGYPIFNFYSPLPYYFGGVLNLFGFDALTATKLMFAFGILLAGFSMYFFAKSVWGEEGGLLSAILYQYAPYHALNIYVRGAVGEFWALAFLPLVFYGIYRVIESVNGKKVIPSHILNIGAIGYAGVILSHNITAMLLTFILAPLLLTTVLIYKNKKITLTLLAMFSIGFLISAFFVLPAILEMKFTDVTSIIGGSADFRKHFVYLDQLWDWPWGFAGSSPGREDGMSFKIGKLHLVLVLLGLAFIILKSKLKLKIRTNLVFISGFLLTVLVFSIFMTTKSSQFVWETFPFLEYAQYPWRFLVFTALSASFLGGTVVLFLKDKLRLVVIMLLIIVILFFNIKYFQPQKFLEVDSSYYTSEENIKWRTSKISDEYLPKDFPVPQTKRDVVREKLASSLPIQVESQEFKTGNYKIDFLAGQNTSLRINTAYFPGWKVFLDGKQKDFSVINGAINIQVDKGRHELVVLFTNTFIRIVANIISLLSLSLLFDKIRRRTLNFLYE